MAQLKRKIAGEQRASFFIINFDDQADLVILTKFTVPLIGSITSNGTRKVK